MKCVICKNEVAKEKNSVVCSDKCLFIRKRLFEIGEKYFPTNGCENCWGDLHGGCSEQCKIEFRQSLEFGKDLWSIIHLIYPEP